MTEDLGTISVGLKVGLGTLDRDLANIKKKIEPIERVHQIPFAVGSISFADVQKEIDKLSQRAIPIQLTAAKGSGAAIHKELTSQLRAAGPVPVRIKANLSVTELTRIRKEIAVAINRAAIPVKISVAGGTGGGAAAAQPAAVVAPRPAAGRAAPVPPVVASAPTAAVTPPQRRSTPRNTTPTAAPSTVAAPTPAQPVPPTAARASTRAPAKNLTGDAQAKFWERQNAELDRQAKRAEKLIADRQELAQRQEAEARKRAVDAYSYTPGATQPPRQTRQRPSQLGGRVMVNPRSSGSNVIDLNNGDQLPLPRTREARRFRRRADPGYDQQRLDQETAKLSDLRSQRLNKSNTPEQNTALSAAVRKQKAVVERAQRAMSPTADTMTEEQKDDARARYERRAELSKRSSSIGYGDLSDVHPKLRQELEAMQMGRIFPILADAFDALKVGDHEGARDMLSGLGLQFKGPSGTRKRKRFGKLFRNPTKADEGQLLQHSALGSLFSEIRIALDPNAVNLHGADYVAPGIKETKDGGVRSTADADLAAANAGLMTFEELASRHPEFATLGLRGTAWEPSTETVGPAPKRRKAVLGPIVKGKVTPAAPMVDPETIPYQGGAEKIGGYPEPPRVLPGRIDTPPPIDLGAEDKRRVVKALDEAVKDAIEAGTPASPEQLSKLGQKFKKRMSGGPVKGSSSERMDRLFGDKPGMWYSKDHGNWRYAHERETAEQYEARNTREANSAHASWEDRRHAGGAYQDLHERMRKSREEARKKTPEDYGREYDEEQRQRRARGTREGRADEANRAHWERSGRGGVCPCGHDRVQHAMLGGFSACDKCACPKFGVGLGQDRRGAEEKSQSNRGPVDSQIDKLKRMATQETQSPNEAAIARSLLRKKGVPGYAMGGQIEGALSRRIREAAERKAMLDGTTGKGSAYLVGENRPETYVNDRGEHEIVGQDGPEVRTFPRDGKIVPFVPEWLKRQTAKDLTGRVSGGPVKGRKPRKDLTGTGQQKFWEKQNAELTAQMAEGQAMLDARATAAAASEAEERSKALQEYQSRSTAAAPEEATAAGRGFVLPGGRRLPTGGASRARAAAPEVVPEAPKPARPTPKAPEYAGKLGAEPGSGLSGRKSIRDEFPGERAAIASGKLSSSGGVQRVFVVNWPAGGFGGGPIKSDPRRGSIAAGPLAGLDDRSAGRLLSRLLKETRPVEAKEEKTDTVAPERAAKPTAEEQVEARLQAVYGAEPRELRAEGVARRARLSETQAYAPVRSLAPSIGQLGGTLLGRGELIKRLSVARDLSALATKAEGEYNAEKKKAIVIQEQLNKAEDPALREELTAKLDDQTAATEKQRQVAIALNDEADIAAKHADALSLKVGTLVGNTAGIIGGTLLFGATLGIAQAGLEAFTQVAGPVIERLLGFKNVSAAVTKQLGEQVRAQNGAADSAVAASFAQAGLGGAVAQTLAPLLTQRAIVEGGNAAFAAQLDLIHSAVNVAREDQAAAAGQPTGFLQPAGGIPGITRSTGGAAGTPIGATPSLFEQIDRELPANDPFTKGLQTLNRFLTPQGAASYVLGTETSATQDLIGTEGVTNALKGKSLADIANPNFLAGAAGTKVSPYTEGGIPLITTQGDLGNFGGTTKDTIQQADLDTLASITGFAAAMEDTTQNAQKAGSSLGFMRTAGLKNAEVIQKQSEATLRQAGVAETTLKAMSALGIAFADTKDATRQLGIKDVKEFGTAALQGASTPDVGQLVKQLTERIIPAQRDLLRAQSAFQREVLGPSQFALSEIANPTPGTAGGAAFSKGLVGRDGGKIDEVAQKSADKYEKKVGGAIEFVNNEIDKGHQALLNLVPADVKGEFSDLLGEIGKVGKQIQSIQLGIQQQQVNLQVAEYNNQLRIARRSLADARDLQAGLKGETRDTLGGMEAQNILLQRRLQLLQFELQQRQINFRIATAGFVTPGSTPEEIAARIKEAKIEAEYAQKQLDIQKQLAANQYKAVTITADRSVTDLLAQISLLEQGKQVTVDTASAQRALDILNKKQQRLIENAGTYIEEGTKISAAAMQAAHDAAAATGESFSDILKLTAEAWGIFGEQAQLILNATSGSAPNTPTQKQLDMWRKESQLREDIDNDGVIGRPYANGIIGDTMGETQMTVGEAAGEKVAIIRAPKIMPMSSLAGTAGGMSPASGGITIVISGNTFSDRSDIDYLIEQAKSEIVDEVEERFNRKASLLLR